MDHLTAINPNQVRIYGGPDSEWTSDEITIVLALATTNLELYLAETAGASDSSTVNPADLEMFTANQTGLHARNMEWLVLSRGMDREDEALMRCNLVVYEIRAGDHLQLGLGQQRALAGKCEYRLRYHDRWRIACEKVVLINRHMPIANLSFLL